MPGASRPESRALGSFGGEAAFTYGVPQAAAARAGTIPPSDRTAQRTAALATLPAN